VSFSIRNLDAAIAKHGAANTARLHGEVARWIQRLIRAEDTAARVGANEFVVILPNTDDSDGRLAMVRIDDVLSHTEFGLDGWPFTLWIASGHASAQSGDTGASLLARARETPGASRR
jgi:diguanylate cyclase (GGDEF)-like protein